MPRRAYALCLALLLALLCAPRAARCAEPREQAQSLREAGDRLYRAKDFGGALARYRHAYEVYRSPMLLVSISAAAEMNREPVEAAVALLQFFANPGDSVPVVRATAERNLERLLGALSPAESAELSREATRRLPRDAWARLPQAARQALPEPTAPAPPAPPKDAERWPAPQPTAAQGAASGAPLTAAAPPQAPEPRPAPRRGLTAAKWIVGTIGLLGAAAGATLLALDGRCVKPFVADGAELCAAVLDSRAAGIALAAAGGVALGTSALLFGLDYRRQRDGGQAALLTLAGSF